MTTSQQKRPCPARHPTPSSVVRADRGYSGSDHTTARSVPVAGYTCQGNPLSVDYKYTDVIDRPRCRLSGGRVPRFESNVAAWGREPGRCRAVLSKRPEGSRRVDHVSCLTARPVSSILSAVDRPSRCQRPASRIRPRDNHVSSQNRETQHVSRLRQPGVLCW